MKALYKQFIRESGTFERALLGLFLLSLVLHFYGVTRAWFGDISGYHVFRQTQTALSAFYFQRTGFQLNYLLPIFGAPWTFPLEFPLFQYATAITASLFMTSLEVAGRAINLILFYGTLSCVYAMLGYVLPSRGKRLFCLSLILLSPTYIFWTRAILIEPLALFFATLFLMFATRGMTTDSSRWIYLSSLFGAVCGLVKITTLITFFIPLTLIFAATNLQKSDRQNGLMQRLILFFVLVAEPLVVSLAWNHYAEVQRSYNVLSAFLDSGTAFHWNVGSLSQRFSVGNLLLMAQNAGEVWGSNTAVVFCLIALCLKHAYRKAIAFCFLSSLAGPLLFFNVYLFHDYYFYSSGMFFVCALALSLLALSEFQPLRKLTLYITMPAVILSLQYSYYYNLLPVQLLQDNRDKIFAQEIKSFSEPDDVVLVYGAAWNSAVAYYSERHTIMNYIPLPPDSPQLKKIIEDISPKKLAVVAVFERKEQQVLNKDSIQQISTLYDVNSTPALRLPGLTIYRIATDNKPE